MNLVKLIISKLNVELQQRYIRQLESIEKNYDHKYIRSRLNFLLYWIENEIDERIDNRFDELVKLGRDSSSLKSNCIRYGEVEGTKRFNEKVNRCTLTKDKLIFKYGDIQGEKKWNDICNKKSTFNLKHYTDKYGKELGEMKWNETLTKKLKTQQENKLKLEANGLSRKNGRTLEEYQLRYGLREGYDRWKKRNDKQSYRFSKQYFIDKYGSKWKVNYDKYRKSMDRTSKKSFIHRYGEVEGSKRYGLYVNVKKYQNSEKYYIDIYGEKIGRKRWQDLNIKRTQNNTLRYSKVSQDLFWNLYELMQPKDREKCFFGELNEEYKFFHINEQLKFICVDFKFNNKIIEFYGDFWHFNPKMYSENDQSFANNVKDKWKQDNDRVNSLTDKGYHVLIIWESDYLENKQEVINKCMRFLNERS